MKKGKNMGIVWKQITIDFPQGSFYDSNYFDQYREKLNTIVFPFLKKSEKLVEHCHFINHQGIDIRFRFKEENEQQLKDLLKGYGLPNELQQYGGDDSKLDVLKIANQWSEVIINQNIMQTPDFYWWLQHYLNNSIRLIGNKNQEEILFWLNLAFSYQKQVFIEVDKENSPVAAEKAKESIIQQINAIYLNSISKK